MALVAQGTVQVRDVTSGHFTIGINPISDYKVNHGKKDYTAFVGDGHECRLFPAEKEYAVDDSLKEVLVQAAFHQVRIEVEIEMNDKEPKVTGLRVPAR